MSGSATTGAAFACPLVSITTPSLNSAAFLPEAIASIEAQTYPRVEHLVIDSVSSDGTQAILDALDPAKHRVVIARDRSMYDAINRGIRQASGEIIGNLNADDLFFPDTIEHVVGFFDRHPCVDIVYGSQLSLLIGKESFEFAVSAREYSDRWGEVLIYVSQPTVFVRRSVFESVGLFDPHLRGAGDFDFWFRCFQKGVRFKRLRRLTAIVRMHGGNLSLSDRWRQEHEQVKNKYLPAGWRRVFWERYRLAKRKLFVNQLTLPFLVELPAYIHFDLAAYLKYLAGHQRQTAPILTVDLPYFRYEAFRALSY